MARNRLLRGASLVCALAALASASAAAQEFPDFSGLGGGVAPLGAEAPLVTVEAEFTPARDDQPAMVFVTAKVADGYHVYAVDQGKKNGGGPQATSIKLAPNQPVTLKGEFRPIQAPKTHIDETAWRGLELREHEGTVTWYAPIEIGPAADLGSLKIKGVFDGQACNENTCVPQRVEFTAQRGPGVPIPAQPIEPIRGAAAETPLASLVGYGILGGLILNLMPCVLPVIGLKVLSFAKQGGESRAHVMALNLAYVAGLMLVFMVLATLAAAVQLGLSQKAGLDWGELNTLLEFKVTMTAVVFAMALSFLGVWELPIPGFATSGKATKLSSQEGPVGAFCMGMFTTVLATPCSGPFLGPVLGYTISQPPAVTYLLFGSVGLGMALPYLLIGAFPSLVSWLPKPGAWMDTFKNLMGFVLLGTVVYLFSTINEAYFIATLALLVGVWFACWCVGRAPYYAPLSTRVRAWVIGGGVATLVGFVSFSLFTPRESALAWQPWSPEALAMARAQGKTVLVDFTADWCWTCQTNSLFAIDTEEVKKLVEQNGVVPLLADWTDRNDVIKQALNELKSRSIPLMAIYPADPNREVMVLPDLISQDQVLEALREAGPSAAAPPEVAGHPQPIGGAPDAPEFGARVPTSTRR